MNNMNFDYIREVATTSAKAEDIIGFIMATPSSRVRNLKQALKVTHEIIGKANEVNDTAIREGIYVALAEQSGLDPFKAVN